MMNKLWVGVGIAAAAVAVTPVVKNIASNKSLNNALSMNQGTNNNSTR